MRRSRDWAAMNAQNGRDKRAAPGTGDTGCIESVQGRCVSAAVETPVAWSSGGPRSPVHLVPRFAIELSAASSSRVRFAGVRTSRSGLTTLAAGSLAREWGTNVRDLGPRPKSDSDGGPADEAEAAAGDMAK
jgi:hypothetical protein